MSSEQNLESKELKSFYFVPGSILAAGIIIAIAVIYSGGGKIKGVPTKGAEEGEVAAVAASGEAAALLEANDNSRVSGSPSAPVTFVEFGDFQCPFCAKFYQTVEKQIIEKYVKTGKVKFIWRDFAFLGQESFDAAGAARCAGEQGKFWQYHDYLFENQKGENQGAFSAANLKQFAGKLGLDVQAFNSCLDSGKYLGDVQKESELGRDLGVSGTPSSFINGQQITGAVPFSQFETAIINALK
ncbi:MAG: DsbA family protein [Patescibacteria group bacterium]